MAFRAHIVAFGFVLACVRLSDAQFSGWRVPTHSGVEVQNPAELEPVQQPEIKRSKVSVQHAKGLQVKQSQPTVEPLSWRFPPEPVEPVPKLAENFELRQPVMTDRVAARCGESKVQVEVSQDLLGLGELIKPEQMTLGGCSATETDHLAQVLVFESELHGCGSTLVMTETSFIYAFTLVYTPKVFSRIGIIRSQPAVIGVECHYPR